MFYKPEYFFIKEFDLSNRILKATNGDATVVFDASTRQYKLLSKTNYQRTNVLEALTIKKEHVNLGLVYHLLATDRDRTRLKQNTILNMKQKTLKNFTRQKENVTLDYLKKIKSNRGEKI